MLGRSIAALLLAAAVAASPAAGAPAQTPKRGGTVVVAWGGPADLPSCVFPSACPNGFNAELMHHVLAGNLSVRPEGWSPNLVSSEVVRDPLTVTLRIRPDARWSDGRPITAADFLFSHRVYRKAFPKEGYVWAEVRRVSAPDVRTVRLEWSKSDHFWLSQVGLFPTAPKHVLRRNDPSKVWERAIAHPLTGMPIGSGPFLLERFSPGRAELVLVRNPRYWASHPAYLDRLVLRFGMNSAEALRSGEVDVVGGGGRDQAAALEFVERPQSGLRVVAGAGGGWEHLDFNLRSEGHTALKNKLVRRALAYGIDRERIVRELFAKTAPDLRVLDSTAFLVSERAYEPNWRRYRYRPLEAQRLLAQAGCRRGDDQIYVCGGERLRLRFVTTGGVLHRQRTLELIQEQLVRVGIEAVPTYAANFDFREDGAYDVALFAWVVKFPGETGSLPYTCDGRGLVTAGYCSRLVDADIGQLERIVDPARYAAVANRADRRLAADVPVLPLYQTLKVYAFRSSLRGVSPNPFWPVTWNSEDWWLAR